MAKSLGPVVALVALHMASPARSEACDSGSSLWFDDLMAPAIAVTSDGTVFTWLHSTPESNELEGARAAIDRDPDSVDFATPGNGAPSVAVGDSGGLVVWGQNGQILAAPLGVALGEPIVVGTGRSAHVSWNGSSYLAVWLTSPDSAVELAEFDASGRLQAQWTLAAPGPRRGVIDLASQGGVTLAVWDEATEPSPSEAFDVVGLRVGLDDVPFPIATGPTAEGHATVAAGHSEFLVGWVDNVYLKCCTPKASHINFARVSIDGQLLDAAPIASFPTGDPNTFPRIASSGGAWLATWNRSPLLEGAVIGGGGEVLTLSSAVGWTHDLAWDGEHYVAAYQTNRSGDGDRAETDIHALWLDKTGAIVVPDMPIATGHDSSGCGCDAGSPPTSSMLLVLLVLARVVARRRRAICGT